MRMQSILTLATALLVACSLQAADLTIDEVLAKNTEAKGGLEKLRAVKTVRINGRMAMGGMEMPLIVTKKRDEKVRVEISLQGMTGIQAYDGAAGWQVMPFMGKKDPEAMSGDDLKQVKEMADFDGPFVDYAKKGHTVELLGKEEIEGTPAFKVKLVTKEGTESTVYIDAESFLEIKSVSRQKVQGQELEFESSIGNYQEVEGLLFAHSMEMKPKGAPAGRTITIEKVELNPAVADDVFAMPAVKPAAEVKE